MIIVTKIETIEVDSGDLYILHHYNHQLAMYCPREGIDPIPVDVIEEAIRGIRIRNSNGVDICVGHSKQAIEAIKLPYEAYKNQEATIEKLWKETFILRNSLRIANENKADLLNTQQRLKKAKFWTRLKWLFTGIMVEV